MNSLEYVLKKFGFEYYIGQMPIQIPNVGRLDLPHIFKDLEFKIGAEIGVERGVYSKHICSINPKIKLYCIDPWKYSTTYRSHVSQEMLDEFCKQTAETLKDYNFEIIRKYSSDAVKDFEDNSLDFVYIDGNHEYKYVLEDLENWSKKVRPGGIISGHDYIRERYPAAMQAVHKFVQDNKIDRWFILGSKERIKGMVRDRSRSYFWIKQ